MIDTNINQDLTIEQKATNAETLVHIHTLHHFLHEAAKNLLDRAQVHDLSKLAPPEVDTFTEFTPKLKNTVYGSDEYKQFLIDMKPALDNHYKENSSHHPEGNDLGVNGMSLLDVTEMLLDWKASSLRTKDGDIIKSLAIQKERFKIDDQLYNILMNTVKEMGLDK